MATARVRKSFRYMADANLDGSDSDTEPAMDEEEQHKLIETLRQHNQTMNNMYIQAFTILPLAASLLFVFYMLKPNTIAALRLLCLLSITSLLGSAFQMWFVPLADTDDAANRISNDTRHHGSSNRFKREPIRSRRIPSVDVQIDIDGPLGRSVPYLNIMLCVLLSISSWALKSRKDVPEEFWMLLLVPLFIFAMVFWARRNMLDVNTGLDDLGKLKYDYKGA